MSSQHHLSPWDISGLGMGFGLYRPRRPSYTYATQARQRSESYRYAVRKSTSDGEEETPDFIEGIIKKKNRKESYIRATRGLQMELRNVCESPPDANQSESKLIDQSNANVRRPMNSACGDRKPIANHVSNNTSVVIPTCTNRERDVTRTRIPNSTSDNHIVELKAAVSKKRMHLSPQKISPNSTPMLHSPATNKELQLDLRFNEPVEYCTEDSVFSPDIHESGEPMTPVSEAPSITGPTKVVGFKKNLVLLCSSFILVFSAFRAIQNLQSTLNKDNDLGIIAITCIHGTMCLTCMWAPIIINSFTAKWALVCGIFSFITWTAGNFYPRFYTLIPLAIGAGVGQGILWTAESSYILKLAFDSSKLNKDGIEREMFRFHGIFLACFQTTHIWGNLISSLVLQDAKQTYALELSQRPPSINLDMYGDYNYTDYGAYGAYGGGDTAMGGVSDQPRSCGVLHQCHQKSHSSDITKDVPSTLWKLMSAYLALGILGFCLIFLCLDKIGARVTPEKSGFEIVEQHISLMVTHKTFRLLIPLLIFSGLQQAFVFSDFNQAYVTCTMGEEYIGYSMIVLGLANVASAILVAVCANAIPREVVFGIGGVIHMALMIGLLIWIPDRNLAVFFILSAAWGLCDAVWQTQCNTLICITCADDTDIAFANYRMLQAFGLTMGFLSGTFMCVSFKLYILMILLVVAIMFYVLAEYKVRQVDSDIYDETIEVH